MQQRRTKISGSLPLVSHHFVQYHDAENLIEEINKFLLNDRMFEK